MTTTKRWSSKEWRDELTAKFGHLLADEEGISLREAHRDLKGMSRDQLRDIYESVKSRIAGPGRAKVCLSEVVEEVAVEDLLPTLAANASRAREEQKKRLGRFGRGAARCAEALRCTGCTSTPPGGLTATW